MVRNLSVRLIGAVAGSAMILLTAAQAEASHRRYHGGGHNGAAAAFAFGALALGVGAAIASSQRSERYYEPAYGNGYAPAYGHGYAPAYNYGYQGYAQPHYYQPRVHYAPQPQHYYGKPAWGYRQHRHEGNRWQRLHRQRQIYNSY